MLGTHESAIKRICPKRRRLGSDKNSLELVHREFYGGFQPRAS